VRTTGVNTHEMTLTRGEGRPQARSSLLARQRDADAHGDGYRNANADKHTDGDAGEYADRDADMHSD
jgi:hypothetical protein